MSKGNKQSRCGPIIVAVDLLPLRPGGENGGIKPAIFTLLRAVGDEAGEDLVFVFLTNSASHVQVKGLARANDLLACVLEDREHPFDELPLVVGVECVLDPVPVDLLRRIGADILYCPFGATTFHNSSIPCIALIADLLHKDYPFTLTPTQVAERECYIQETIRLASKIQCISRSGMDQILRHYNLPLERLFYTYLPIHVRLSHAKPDKTPVSHRFLGRPFFFYPANIWVHKNHEVLLLGYLQYRFKAGKVAWDLVLTFQEDARSDYLRSLAKSLGISDSVHFVGFVTEAELHGLWQLASALVFPSLHEGFGIPVLEAMHYSVPIICGNELALGEIAGDASYRINSRKPTSLANALLEVSGSSELRAKLIKLGKDRLQLFELESAAQALLREFRSLLASETDFPRKPGYMREPPLFTAPTPFSLERWKIEMVFNPSASRQKFDVYLDDFPFGTVSSPEIAGRSVSFVCRPAGRLLSLRPAANGHTDVARDPVATSVPVTRVAASDDRSHRILLYEADKEDIL